jgi:hypothetical protein
MRELFIIIWILAMLVCYCGIVKYGLKIAKIPKDLLIKTKYKQVIKYERI